jgi:thiol:disulfide interchange protein
MKTVSLLCLSLFLLPAAALAQQPPHAAPAARKPIYDEKADGAQQIEKALALARKQKKNVLLQFGANWCIWCHRLHELSASDRAIAATIKKGYVVVLIDVNEKHNAETNTRYGNPTQFGLPAIVVLDRDGKQLTTQDTGKLEEGDHHDPAKVLAFLQQWAPSKP